jgi:hypothetical protein
MTLLPCSADLGIVRGDKSSKCVLPYAVVIMIRFVIVKWRITTWLQREMF